MKTFLLVHNGFAGGWVWREVERHLRNAGCMVFSPTLTGLGERAHLAHPDIDLDTHNADVLGTIACEDISNITLVGSSSSSMVVTGVTEKIPERIRRLVYLDTPVPEDGESWIDLMTQPVAAPILAAAREHGDGWRIPLTDVTPPRWVPHPLKTVTQPLTIGNQAAVSIPRTFIHCTDKPEGWFFGFGPVIARAAEKARTQGWDYREMKADHLPQLSKPTELASLLLALQ